MLMLAFLIILLLLWKIYQFTYFSGKKFALLKARISQYIYDCNGLNEHIEVLKNTYLGIDQLDYGVATYYDQSRWNYRRPEFKNHKYAPNIYNCSRTVCDNARKQPFKYICKYFNIKPNETSLEKFENVLNNFAAAEQGKELLVKEKNKILESIKGDIPFLIRTFSRKRLERKLGFNPIDLKTIYFPKYIFKYVSSGGNASTQCDILMDIDNLNRFINYLSEIVKFKNSAAGQRALMTSALRQQIMYRDNFTCKMCGASVQQEPNLLLEIDHIIPISKGGLTTKDNLQTLCWRCNRRKGAKVNLSNT